MSGGVGAGLVEALEAVEDVGQAVQAALFDQLTDEDTGALDTPSPFSGSLAVKSRGRPKGARGKRTAETAAWLLSMHRHPLAVLMEGYSMSPIQFAERIGLQRPMIEVLGEPGEDGKRQVIDRVQSEHFDNGLLLEIVKLQARFAETCLPYVAQRQPLAVQVEGKQALQVMISGVSLPARGVAAEAGEGQVIEGIGGLKLPKSDDPSRTED